MTQISVHEKRVQTFNKLKTDLPTFAKFCLKVRDKQGKIVPLELNRAQLYMHQCCEDQKRRMGMVRLIVLKGRQQGMSTYIAARYFHNTLLNRGTATFILSHEGKSTATLFDMVKRYHDRLPDGFSPGLAAANKNQLKFEGTDSEYTVGTAGNEDVGRSMTIKNLHMSEVAFYERTDQLETGLMNTVADMEGTEIIMESTANGLGNMFHDRAMKAVAKLGNYEIVFIPWHWSPEYRLQPPSDFTPTHEELELAKQYELDFHQLYWRRIKIENTRGGLWKFQQEYPFTVQEAFLMSGETFFSKEHIINARKAKVESPEAAVIMGIDCARGNDRSTFVVRKGRKILHYETHKDLRADGLEPTQQLIALSQKLIDRFHVDKAFCDMGSGYGVVDGLKSMPGYKQVITGISFAQKVMDEIRFLNKRSEMYGLARDWLEDGNVQIPDTEEFAFDLLLTPKEKETPTKRMFLPSKAEIKAERRVSPDITDAFVLTFAFPVPDKYRHQSPRHKTTKKPGFIVQQRLEAASSRTREVSIQVDFQNNY